MFDHRVAAPKTAERSFCATKKAFDEHWTSGLYAPNSLDINASWNNNFKLIKSSHCKRSSHKSLIKKFITKKSQFKWANSLLRRRRRWVRGPDWTWILLRRHDFNRSQQQRDSHPVSALETRPNSTHQPVTFRHKSNEEKDESGRRFNRPRVDAVPRVSVSSSRLRLARSSEGCWLTSATALRGTLSSSTARENAGQRRKVSRTAHTTK